LINAALWSGGVYVFYLNQLALIFYAFFLEIRVQTSYIALRTLA
jgi:hypothetical protein